MKVRWEIKFVSVDGESLTLQIYDAAATDDVAVAELTGAAQPFSTEEEDDDDPYTPVRSQSGYVRFVADDAAVLAALMPATATARPVVLRDSSGAALWQGFLSTEQYTQPWEPVPYEVEVPVVGIMAAMEGVDFTQDDGWTGVQSLVDTVARYLPDGLAPVFPDTVPVATVCVENANWQTYLTATEREDNGTTDKYETKNLREVMEDFCKYFGLSCRERGALLYFTLPGETTYSGAADSKGISKIYAPAAHDVSDLDMRAADNTAQYAKAYRQVSGEFATGRDTADDMGYEQPTDYAEAFGVLEAGERLVKYYDNDEVQAYAEGKRTTTYSYDADPVTPSFGQIASLRRINQGGSSTEMTWMSGFFVKSRKGRDGETALRVTMPRPLYFTAADFDTVISLQCSVAKMYGTAFGNFDVWADDDSGHTVPSLYVKLRLGKHWLSTVINDDGEMSANWSDDETVSRVLLADGTAIARTKNASGSSLDMDMRRGKYAKLDGLCMRVPADLLGSTAGMVLEIRANEYTDDEWSDYGRDVMQYLISGLRVSVERPTSARNETAASDDSNTYRTPTGNAAPSKYSVTAAITTCRAQQYGTGCALSASGHGRITVRYDQQGVKRRAKMLAVPRPEISLTVKQRPQPIDTVTWQGRPYVVLSESDDWRDGTARLLLLNATDTGGSSTSTGGGDSGQTVLPDDGQDVEKRHAEAVTVTQLTAEDGSVWRLEGTATLSYTATDRQASLGLASQDLLTAIGTRWRLRLTGWLYLYNAPSSGDAAAPADQDDATATIVYNNQTVTAEGKLTFDGDLRQVHGTGYMTESGYFDLSGKAALKLPTE